MHVNKQCMDLKGGTYHTHCTLSVHVSDYQDIHGFILLMDDSMGVNFDSHLDTYI